MEANREQARALCGDCRFQPKWAVCCGSRLGEALASVLAEHDLPVDTRADFLLTCPPYYDLEPYGNGIDDLSGAASYEAFLADYERIVVSSTALLKHQHVAVFVVGNVRDKEGALLDLHGDTKRLLGKHGNVLYCDAVLKTALSSAPQRAGRQMRAASKLVTVHQNVVVSCRGCALDTASCRALGIKAAVE